MAEHSVSIDDVSSAESDAAVTISRVLDVAAVVFADLLRNIRKHGNGHGSETTLLTVFLSVFHVGEAGVD